MEPVLNFLPVTRSELTLRSFEIFDLLIRRPDPFVERSTNNEFQR